MTTSTKHVSQKAKAVSILLPGWQQQKAWWKGSKYN